MLIVLTGPGSVGKDAIVSQLLKKNPDLNKVITTTSRQPRPWETSGKDYHFVSPDEFEKLVSGNALLEHVNFAGNYYGTQKTALDPYKNGENMIWKVEITMGAKVKDFFHDAKVFYIDVPDWSVLRERLSKRGASEEIVNQRLEADKRDWETYKDKFENIVINYPEKLDQTVEKIQQLIS